MRPVEEVVDDILLFCDHLVQLVDEDDAARRVSCGFAGGRTPEGTHVVLRLKSGV